MNEDMKAKLKKIAMENYENGGDAMIECWDDAQWDEFLTDEPNPEQRLYQVMGIFKEREQAVLNEIF